MRILSVGEVLWDVFADSEHLGGAPLNFAFHATRLGHEVALLSAVGDDQRGAAVRDFAGQAGISTRFLATCADAPTGVVTVCLKGAAEPVYRFVRPAAYDRVSWTDADGAALREWRPDWIYYGTLFASEEAGRLALRGVLGCNQDAGRCYDVNLRAGQYTPELVRRLAQSATVLKLSEEEMREAGEILECPTTCLEQFARAAATRYGYQAVCVTRGAGGCGLLGGEEFVECPGQAVEVADPVGAGDAFAAAFLHGWQAGWPLVETGCFANRVGALVASRPGATPAWSAVELPG